MDIFELAVHPDWVSRLHLDSDTGLIQHENVGSKGSFELTEGKLLIRWKDFPSESFSKVGPYFIHDTILSGKSDRTKASIPNLERLAIGAIGAHRVPLAGVLAFVPESNHQVELRLLSSDIPTFQQVFIRREYESDSLPLEARTIVDLGANIGLSTVFFGLRYPQATIVAVEPNPENFRLLERNTARLGDRVIRLNEAIWWEDGSISLKTEDDQGRPLGGWGTQTVAADPASSQVIPCRSMTSLLRSQRISEIDILKVDIEGAEEELFSKESEQWVHMVKMLFIETHDRFKPGSEATVREALSGRFREANRCGENLVFCID
jgi:FkbM family methyltransferase